MDVLPGVELGPVGQRKNAQTLALAMTGVVQPPQLRPLLFRIPTMLRRAKREDAFLGPALLLVAPGAAESRVEMIFVQGLAKRLRFHHVGVHLRAVRERVDARGE